MDYHTKEWSGLIGRLVQSDICDKIREMYSRSISEREYMPKVTVYNQQGAIVGSQELSDKVFGVKVKNEVVHQVAVAMMANQRQVLAHTKGRSEVRGGGRKPWRQKGTGRARHGSIRSPLWVGGGITFGPTKERNFKKKINDKMRRKAILMCLSDRVADGKLVLLDKLELAEAKTKQMATVVDKLHEVFYGKEAISRSANKEKKGKEIKKLRNSEIKPDFTSSPAKALVDKKAVAGKRSDDIKKVKVKPKKILVLLEKKDEKVKRACRNVPWLTCQRAQDVNVLDVLAHEFVLVSVGGAKKIEETF